MKKTIIFILGILVLCVSVALFITYISMSNLVGGGGVNQEVPDEMIVGESASLRLYASLTGKSGTRNIDEIYPAATLYYRLSGENTYQSISGKKISLPSNYQAVVSANVSYKAFEFIVPSYPLNATGDVEYYFELQTPSNPNGSVQRIEGLGNIHIRTFNPLENMDKTGARIIVD
ncbi:MAG: hypothetical protein WAT81_04515 [Candidatus Moraniibacteriota bacterium]